MEDRLRFYSISPVDLLFEADQLLLPPALQNGFVRFALVCLKDGGCLDAPKSIARAARLSLEDAQTLRTEIEDVCEVRDGRIAPKLVWGLIEHAEQKSQKARNSALAKASQTQTNASDSSADGKRVTTGASRRKRTQANASERLLSEVKLSEENYSATNVAGADAPTDAPSEFPTEPPTDPEPSPSVVFKNTVVAAFRDTLAEIDPEAPPYVPNAKDAIQVEALRKRCLKGSEKGPWEMTPERLTRALANYRASPIGTRTLADFAVRFSTFYAHPLNEFGRPVEVNGNGNGKQYQPDRGADRNAAILRERDYDEIDRIQAQRRADSATH